MPLLSQSPQFNKQQRYNGLPNHETFLMCSGKAAIKIETNFPVSRYRVFHHEKPTNNNHKVIHAANKSIKSHHHHYCRRHFIDIYHWFV